MNKRGLLFVISGPAGSGKSSVVSYLLKTGLFEFSVSATTRAPRPGEKDGIQYYFVTKEEFSKKIENGEMLEYAEYVGNYYGTPSDAVKRCLSAGKNIILEIEVKGERQVKAKMPDAVTVLILPPDAKILADRLRGRGTEDEATVLKRLEAAKYESAFWDDYDYLISNDGDGPEKAAEKIISIEIAEKLRLSRNKEHISGFFN